MANFEDFEAKRMRLDEDIDDDNNDCNTGIEEKESGEGERKVDVDKKVSGEELREEGEEEEVVGEEEVGESVEENDSEESENDSESEGSESEEITRDEWQCARDKCRKTIARQVAKKWGVSNVGDAELDDYMQRKIDWMDYKMDKYEFQFVEEELLNKCCNRLGFGGGILNNYTILSLAILGQHPY
jgi:hypothetical protein